MKNNVNFRVFSGIMLGITAILFLTLKFWGDNLYQIIISLILGSLIGMVIIEPKLFWSCCKQAFINSAKLLTSINSKKINLDPDRKKDNIDYREIFNRIWRIVWRIIVPTVVLLIVEYLLGLLWLKFLPPAPTLIVKNNVQFFPFVIIFVVEFLSLVAYTSLIFYLLEKEIISKNSGGPGNWPLAWSILLALFTLPIYFLLILVIDILRSVPALVLLLIQTIFSVPVASVLLIKMIAQNGKLFLTVLCIIIGGLLGTHYHSFLVGYTSGTISLLIFILVNYAFKNKAIELDYFYEGQRNFMLRYWSKTKIMPTVIKVMELY